MGMEGWESESTALWQEPSARLPHGPGERGRDEGAHDVSPFIICPVIQDPAARPKRMVPIPVPAEPHPPRDTTRLTFTL